MDLKENEVIQNVNLSPQHGYIFLSFSLPYSIVRSYLFIRFCWPKMVIYLLVCML